MDLRKLQNLALLVFVVLSVFPVKNLTQEIIWLMKQVPIYFNMPLIQ